jgi:hypothetical protein
MKNARKYISLANTEQRQQEKADMYGGYISFNAEKRDAWQAKADATNLKLDELSQLLTEEEREAVNEHYACDMFEDYV